MASLFSLIRLFRAHAAILLLFSLTRSAAGQLSAAQTVNATKACAAIAKTVSPASSVYYPFTAPLQYAADIAHYGSNNALPAVCSVEPGTATDVGIVLLTIGNYSVPFGVKSGGHCLNAGCSSSYGIQVAMTRFNQVTFNSAAKTMIIGTGLTWDAVYAGLQSTGYTANGGRVSGVGVGGYTLGGGYSWRTNQYGLTCDTVKSLEIVLPSGVVANTSDPKYSDLLFGLRGGQQNFGIVTNMELYAVQDGTNGVVYGGLAEYSPADVDPVFDACSSFDLYNSDVKASILCDYVVVAGGIVNPQIIFFYDAATVPSPSPFVNFTKITPLANTAKSQTFTSFVQGIPANTSAGQRGLYHSASVYSITPAIIKAMKSLAATLLPPQLLLTGTLATITPEPFIIPAAYSHSTHGAYPHEVSRPFKPIDLNFLWLSPTSDTTFQSIAKQFADGLVAAAVADGQAVTPQILYPNYALADTPLVNMYGDNLPALKALAAKYDPNKVMTLAGVFHFQ